MSDEKTFTRVIFRTYPKERDVVAILLDAPANRHRLFEAHVAIAARGYVVCYQHLGQHGEGHYRHLIDGTRPATPEEYEPLKQELQQIGYRFTKIHQRRPLR